MPSASPRTGPLPQLRNNLVNQAQATETDTFLQDDEEQNTLKERANGNGLVKDLSKAMPAYNCRPGEPLNGTLQPTPPTGTGTMR